MEVVKKKSEAEELKFVRMATHDELMAYIAENSFRHNAIVALIKRGNHDEIMRYISKYVIRSEAEYVLIERGNHEEIMVLVESMFYDKNRLALLKRGNTEEIQANMMISPYCAICEKALLDRGDAMEIKTYITKYNFNAENERIFMQRFPHEIGVYVHRFGVYSENCLELLARGDNNVVLSYVSKYLLRPKAEKALVKRGQHNEIMAYIHSDAFNEDDTQVALIKRGNHEEIMMLIQVKDELSPAAEKALDKRCNHEEIIAYGKKIRDKQKAQDDLFDRLSD